MRAALPLPLALALALGACAAPGALPPEAVSAARLDACEAYALVAIEAGALAEGAAFPPEQTRQLAAIHAQQAILCDPARPAGLATAALVAANTVRAGRIVAEAGG